MTEDELDLLASAYLDGEATSEEVAMVDRDPELLARVEELRTVSEQLSATAPASAEIKERHLAAALATFSVEDDGAVAGAADRSTVDPVWDESSADVIDLTRRSSRGGTERRATGPGATGAPSRSILSWLPAAAALLILGGGGAFLFSQASTGDDSAETATESFDEATDEAVEDAADGALLTQDDAEVRASSAETEAGSPESGDEDDAMDDEEAMEESEEELPTAAEGDADQSAPADGESGEGGFFPDEPVLFFDAPPDPDELLAELPERRFDLSMSECGESLGELTPLEPVAFLPIAVGGEPAELFVLIDTDGSETALVVDRACTVIIP